MKSVLNAGFLQFSFHEKIDLIFWPMDNTEKTLKDLRYSIPYRQIIVDIETEEIVDFLKSAYDMHMLTSYHHYMFTSLVCIIYICLHLAITTCLLIWYV